MVATPKPLGILLLIAIVGALIAGIQSFQSSFVGTYEPILFAIAGIAAIVEFTNLYQNGPAGTPLPWKTLGVFIVSAAVYLITWAIHQTLWNEATGVAGALIFLTYLETELQTGAPPAPSSSTPTPSAAGPPS